MSDHKEHIIHYSAADIQRYVQGKMTAREMHAIEKAALDDPFLADAIEGMQEAFAAHEERKVTGQLQQLQQQFQTRTTSAKVVAFKPFRYWQAAAAVAVVVCGVWIYTLVSDTTSKKNAPVIAKTEEKPKQQPEPAPPVVEEKKEIPSATDPAPEKRAVTPKTAAPAHKNQHQPAADDKLLSRADQSETAPVTPAPAVLKESAERRSVKTDTVTFGRNTNNWATLQKDKNIAAKQDALAAASAAAREYKKEKEPAYYNANFNRDRETELITIKKNDTPKRAIGINNNLSGVIKGQVTDQNSNPIANAYVQIPKNNNNFVTDKTGFFKIPASDSVVDVAVNVTGYGTQNFTLKNNADVTQLKLQPANAALQEVVVSTAKYKKLSVDSKLPNAIVHDAEPAGGWAAFDQYLENNKKVPANGPTASGQVIVSFEVNKKGTLSGFKIEQSLSNAYDEEAIRLITQGPAWKLLKKGRKARVTVIVRY
jgi:outer membrane biosynthesis protein TonB